MRNTLSPDMKYAISRVATVAVILAHGLSAQYANAETKVGADVSLSTSYYDRGNAAATNARPNGFSVVADVAPHISIVGPVSTWTISGGIRHDQYISHSDETTDYRANIGYRGKWDARTEAHFAGSYNRSYLANVFSRPGLIVGNDPNLPPVIDPTLAFDEADTVTSFGAEGGISHALSARDNVGVSASYRGNRHKDATLREYDTYSGGLNYSRTLNERMTIGVAGQVTKTQYLGTSLGDTTSYSPQATLQYRINAYWKLDASAGMSFQRYRSTTGTRNSSGFQGSATLCRSTERSNLCAVGQYGYAPSSINGAARTLTAGANYSYTLSPRTSISAFMTYSRSDEIDPLIDNKVEYMSVGGRVNRKLTERISAFVSASYGNVKDDLISRPSTIVADVGIKIALGQ
tara:strand:+ start:100768 stop:101982 length:1215 start_codon:yes stop_codon:yes gene_type:complete